VLYRSGQALDGALVVAFPSSSMSRAQFVSMISDIVGTVSVKFFYANKVLCFCLPSDCQLVTCA
jgi:hypothetical protein